MPPFQPPHVLVVAQTNAAAMRWAAALAGAATHIWIAPQHVPSATSIELIVTDLPTADEARRGALDAAVADTSRAAVLGVGSVDGADLCLAADSSADELSLACLLLGEIARLRAERDHATRSRQEIRELAFTDPLTGLANRRAWDARLEMQRQPTLPAGKSFALAIVDLDRFKEVNDTCGLAEGDAMLRRAADAIAGSLRSDDLVARLGGDEFGVLLASIDDDGAQRVLERLRAAVAALAPPEGAGCITASIGYAISGPTDQPTPELFDQAESGLRLAKRAGGNRVCRADES